jgi:hypothetical protein
MSDSSPSQFVAFARGIAIFRERRISKAEQEKTLREKLPGSVAFAGAFDKSGNYAFRTRLAEHDLSREIVGALRSHPSLSDLMVVVVKPAERVKAGLDRLISEVQRCLGKNLDRINFGIELDGYVWRAGLSFLPESITVPPSPGSLRTNRERVILLGGEEGIVRFLKKENKSDERRITFGDPTNAVDDMLQAMLGQPIESTSRSGRTVRGVLRLLVNCSA